MRAEREGGRERERERAVMAHPNPVLKTTSLFGTSRRTACAKQSTS